MNTKAKKNKDYEKEVIDELHKNCQQKDVYIDSPFEKEQLNKFLSEDNIVLEDYTIMLNGKFGSGKTFFIDDFLKHDEKIKEWNCIKIIATQQNSKLIKMELLNELLKNKKCSFFKKSVVWYCITWVVFTAGWILLIISLNKKWINDSRPIFIEIAIAALGIFFSLVGITNGLFKKSFFIKEKFSLKNEHLSYYKYQIDNKINKNIKNKVKYFFIIEDIDRLPQEDIKEILMSINTLLIAFKDEQRKNIKFLITLDIKQLNEENKSFLSKIVYKNIYFSGLNDFKLKKVIDQKLSWIMCGANCSYVEKIEMRNIIFKSNAKLTIREINRMLNTIIYFADWFEKSKLKIMFPKNILKLEHYYFIYIIYDFLVNNIKEHKNAETITYVKYVFKYINLFINPPTDWKKMANYPPQMLNGSDFKDNEEVKKIQDEVSLYFSEKFNKWESFHFFLYNFNYKNEMNHNFERLAVLMIKFLIGEILDVQKELLFNFDYQNFKNYYFHNDDKFMHLLYKIKKESISNVQKELIDYFENESYDTSNARYFSNMMLFIDYKFIERKDFNILDINNLPFPSLIYSSTILPDTLKTNLFKRIDYLINLFFDFVKKILENWEDLNKNLNEPEKNSTLVFYKNIKLQTLRNNELNIATELLWDKIVHNFDSNIIKSISLFWKWNGNGNDDKLKVKRNEWTEGAEWMKGVGYILNIHNFFEEFVTVPEFFDKLTILAKNNEQILFYINEYITFYENTDKLRMPLITELTLKKLKGIV